MKYLYCFKFLIFSTIAALLLLFVATILGASGAENVGNDARAAMKKFLRAVESDDASAIKDCFVETKGDREKLVDAFVARVLVYRSLLHATSLKFPQEPNSASRLLSQVSDEHLKDIELALDRMQVVEVATGVMIGNKDTPFATLSGAPGSMKVSSLGGVSFAPDASDTAVMEAEEWQRKAAAIGHSVEKDVEGGKFSSMREATLAFDNSISAMSHEVFFPAQDKAAATRPSTSTSTAPALPPNTIILR